MSVLESTLGFLGQAQGGVLAQAEVIASSIGLSHYLALSAITFALGLLVIITRRNAIAVLMGIELIFNSAGLNFVAFSKYSGAISERVDGQVVTLFLIVIAAAEAALALAIVLNIYNNLKTVDVDEASSLKG